MRIKDVKDGKQLELVLDNRLKSIIARLGTKAVLKVGILEGATTTDGQNIAQYAFWNEFGTKFSPARPFMRQSVEKNKGRWLSVLKRALTGGKNSKDSLYAVGEVARADVIDEIQNGTFTPNAPRTIALKKAKGKTEPDHPLIDTGQMMKAVSYEVTDEL